MCEIYTCHPGRRSAARAGIHEHRSRDFALSVWVRRVAIRLCASILLALTAPALAVQPDEMLKDPALEARARALSQTLRCMVCQNESIDESSAPLARDLRLLVRERIKAGDSDAEVQAYLVARYGEFILLQPRFSSRTWLLWGIPIVVLLAGGAGVLLAIRRRKAAPVPLDEDERRRLEALLEQNNKA